MKSILDCAAVSYTFDDFFLAPVHSNIRSRKDPDLSVWVDKFKYNIPIISSPMNTVTGEAMMRTMYECGGSGVLHRYMSIDDQISISKRLLADGIDFWIAVGANGDAMERVDALGALGVKSFCIDVANGHSIHCIEAVARMRDRMPDARIMAGNVCTFDGAYRLAKAGADVLRVGVGSGSVCITRLVTGHGVPQLSAIEDCVKIKSEKYINELCSDQYKNSFPDVTILSDGGTRSAGDIVKALAIGADAVMLGSMLAGSSDTPGEIHKDPVNGSMYKYYSGMASVAGRSSWFDRERTSFVPEGESTSIAYKGETKEVIGNIVGGVRSGLSYAGANNISELRKNAQWRRVTQSGAHEAKPHAKL